MRDVFEPARQDLRIAHLKRLAAARTGWARAASRVRYGAAVALLGLDCVRLWAPWRAQARTPHRQQEPFTMFAYYLRHALRLLVRERGFTAAAVVTLALGVGANAAVFAVVEAVLLRPLPYRDADTLVVLNHRDQRTGITKEFIGIGDYVDLAAQQSVFESIGAYGGRRTTVYNMGEPFRATALLATSSAIDALSVRPVLGRTLQPDDSRPARPRSRYSATNCGRSASAPTRGLSAVASVSAQTLPDRRRRPAGLPFPPDAPTELILPLTMPLQAPAGRKNGWTFSVARLKDGVAIDAAQTNLAALSRRFEVQFPRENQGSQYFAVRCATRSLATANRRSCCCSPRWVSCC